MSKISIINVVKPSDEKNDPMSVKNLAQFGVNAVQHQDPEVRQAGQELVLLLYKVMLQNLIILVGNKTLQVDQDAVRKEMPEDNNSNR